MASFVLASQSPRRLELLRGFSGHSIRVLPADCDEHCALKPRDAVGVIAERKARAVTAHAGEVIIAADTLVDLDGRPLGKPANADEAKSMLSRLSDRRHCVHTGVTVALDGRYITETETSYVRFGPLTAREIRDYVATGEPMDKAGAYGIQGRGALFVAGIEGDFYNVMGLPLYRLSQMLGALGVKL